MDVYPNPIKDKTTIQYTLSESTTFSIQLVDVSGKFSKTILPKQTMPAGDHQQEINCSNLPNGTYFLTFLSKNGQQSVQVLVQH